MGVAARVRERGAAPALTSLIFINHHYLFEIPEQPSRLAGGSAQPRCLPGLGRQQFYVNVNRVVGGVEVEHDLLRRSLVAICPRTMLKFDRVMCVIDEAMATRDSTKRKLIMTISAADRPSNPQSLEPPDRTPTRGILKARSGAASTELAFILGFVALIEGLTGWSSWEMVFPTPCARAVVGRAGR